MAAMNDVNPKAASLLPTPLSPLLRLWRTDCFFNRALRSSSNLLFHCVSSWAGHASFRGRHSGASRAATSIGRIGSGCLAFRRAMMRSGQLRLCPGSLVRTGRTATKSWFPVGDHIVRRAPPSPRCRTGCHRSTWHGAPRRVCGPRRPARVCGPSCGPAEHRSCAAMKAGRGRS